MISPDSFYINVQGMVCVVLGTFFTQISLVSPGTCPVIFIFFIFIFPSFIVRGVLYLIAERHLRSLDAHEGYPKVYRRMWLDIEFNGSVYQAATYEMTAETKAARDGKPYPEEYRMLCSAGARYHHVKNAFTKKRKASK